MNNSSASVEAKLRKEAQACERCPHLATSRSQVVFASGPVTATLMFVGEAPGAAEDKSGVPFVGASGKLLDQLLSEIGLSREDVYIANVLKCRPPDNRDPRSDEIANCFEYLEKQVEVVEPAVVVTLGNFASKLLRSDDAGISMIRGNVQTQLIGSRVVWLLPVFHPAAALYRRPNLELLRQDFALLPDLLLRGAPPQLAQSIQPHESSAVAPDDDADEPDGRPQLDLF